MKPLDSPDTLKLLKKFNGYKDSQVIIQFPHSMTVAQAQIFFYPKKRHHKQHEGDDNVTLDLFCAKFTDPCLLHNPLTLKKANSKMFNYRELAS